MSWPFVQAVNYHKGRLRNGVKAKPRLIVMHDMEAPEGPLTAENVANWFGGRNGPAPMASAHFNCDLNSVVQSVRLADTAFAAPNANADGVHIEQAGYARRSRAEWLADDAMLNIASCVAAELVAFLRYFGTPVELRRLGPAEIKGGVTPGFCGHLDVTRAFSTAGGHTDPGGEYPWDVFLAKVGWWLGHVSKTDFV